MLLIHVSNICYHLFCATLQVCDDGADGGLVLRYAGIGNSPCNASLLALPEACLVGSTSAYEIALQHLYPGLYMCATLLGVDAA
eukprot:SAG31_NODE_1750_length_7353_cov_17.309209_2_plen_84_part_00